MKSFSVRIIQCSTFLIGKLQIRRSLHILSPQCIRFRLLNRNPAVINASLHSVTLPNYLKEIYATNSVVKYSSDSSVTDECLDYTQFSDLAENSNIETKIKLILMEYEVSKQSGGKMPSTITTADMKELLEFSTEGARSKYFYYLFKKEKDILADKRKKEKRRIEYETRKQERQANQPGPKNTFFLHIRNVSMLKFYNSRQAHSMMFGSTLVFDMGYEKFMAKKDRINCASQISVAYGANKVHCDPFNLYICNAKREYETMHYIENAIPHLYAANCLINVTEMSYLDIFPKDRIVYLTPNADEMLSDFDHDAVYIVGGYIDKSNSKPLSLAKAKQENLKMAKLPLDYYLRWGEGSKTLTLNQMMEIMLEVKTSNNWKEAFKFVPTRKLRSADLDAKTITSFKKKENYLARKLKASSLFDKD